MAWLALCDFREPLFSRTGLTAANATAPVGQDLDAELNIGTFVIEGRFEPTGNGHQTLLSYRRPGENPLDFSVTLIESDGAALLITSADAKVHYAVSANLAGRDEVVRITYS